MTNLKYKSNVKGLFEEIIGSNNQMWIMRQPLKLTYQILQEVAQRSQEINDPKLNCLMLRLSLYDINDPQSENFDQDAVEKYLDQNS